MAFNKIGRGLIVTGITGLAASLLLTLLPAEKAQIRPIQILLLELASIAIMVGLWLRRREAAGIVPARAFRTLLSRALDLSTFAWVITGFLLVYILLFLIPVFLRPGMQMSYFTGYIPNLVPIGNDLTVMVDLIKGWVAGDRSPYTIQFYPPLTYILFAPLLILEDPLALYRFFTLFTFVSYCLLSLVLPLKIMDRKHFRLALLLFVTGLLSYGFQFELERGQYNVFTFLLCLTAVYLFHHHPRYQLLAYVLFSISIQLKLYPAIFIVMFVDDWRNWKRTLPRFGGIALLNLLLFFVMGYQTFWDFIRSVTAQVANPTWIGVWNHSISSFISVVRQDGLGLIPFETLRAFRHNAGRVEAFLILSFAVLFLCALVISYLRKKPGLDPYILLACTVGALVLPISYDYTLSLLTAPMLLFFSGLPDMKNSVNKAASAVLTLGISVTYFSILIPYNYRPYVFHNSFPLLFLLLILATLLNFLRYHDDRLQVTGLEPAA